MHAPGEKPESSSLDLERRVELEALVARVSRSFVGVPPDELDQAIDSALAEIGKFVGADRSYVFLHDFAQGTSSNTHEWCAEGITAEKDNLQDIPLEAFPYLMRRLEEEVFVDIPVVADLPPEAGFEKENLLAQGIKSLVLVAMRGRQGNAIGFAGFDAVKREQPWYPSDYHLLQLAADLISAAVDGRTLWRRLARSEVRNRAILEALPDTMVVYDRKGRVLDMHIGMSDPDPGLTRILETQTLPEFLGPEKFNLHREIMPRIDAGESPVITEISLDVGGEIRYFEVMTTGCARGEYLSLVRDISQRKHDEVALRSLALQLSNAEEDQRRKLAQLLHDGIGQDLSALHYQLQACLEEGPPAPDRIEKMIGLLRDAMRKTQDLTFDLSPPLLYELGLGPALQALVRKFDQDHAGRYSMVISGPGAEPDAGAAVLLYRIARELLVNAAKHAGADEVSVRLEKGARNLVLTVSDNGRGFEPAGAGPRQDPRPGGFGLFSIRQQLEPLGGSLELDHGAGTRITITLPRDMTTRESGEEADR